MPQKAKKPVTKKKTKKTAKKTLTRKISHIFISIFLFVFLIFASTLTYFSITLFLSPKSIPIVTHNIESFLSQATNNNVKIDDSKLHITRNINLKVSTNNLKIIDRISNAIIVTLPEVDIEIPIFPMLFGNFSPSKFIVSNADLVINHQPKDSNPKSNPKSSKQILNKITNFFVNLKNNSHKNSVFEIENTNLTIIGSNSSKSLYIKSSKITSDFNMGKLLINFHNQITVNDSLYPFNLNLQCVVNKSLKANCGLQAQNIKASSFAWLHDDLLLLNKINANFNINSKLEYSKNSLQKLEFSVNSRNGNFKYDGFFDNIIFFDKLQVQGKYDGSSQNLKLDEIAIILKKTKKDYTKYNIQPSIRLKLDIFKDKQLYDLTLDNILIEELDTFWPSHLARNGSRKWSISHLKDGFIKTANAKFEVAHTKLKNITAKLLLEDATVNYSKRFPQITKVSAVADFDIKSMNINITSGRVLQSKITSGSVSIADFSDDKVRLKINGNLKGHASNLLQHAAYESNFSKHISKYFNGQAKSTIELSIPLNYDTTTKSLYLKATSDVINNDNNYLEGSSNIEIISNAKSSDFNVKITAHGSKVNCDILGIHKDANEALKLSLLIDTKNLDKIKLTNINISQPEKNNNISADMEFDTSPFKITQLNVNNSNFSQNNYDLKFDLNDKQLSIKGSNLNLAKAISNKAFEGSSNNDTELDFSKLQIVLKDLKLANNISLNDAYIFYDCENGLCKDGIISLRKNDKQFLKLDIKETAKNYTKFDGKILDFGELAAALGISDLVKDGKAKITAKNTQKDNKFVLTGKIEIYDGVTIFENESVKLLAKDNLYSTIKNKIFSNNKTTFNKVKIEFELVDKIFKIKSLIANNYKIGITAKGTIDLENKIYDLEGFILPGYIVNNLFGLGNIPIIGEVANLLTNGKGGGLFGIKYKYSKQQNEKDFHFKTNKMSAILPTTIQGLF